MSEAKWYLRTQDETFGPESEDKLIEWAKLGRIQPGQEISDDNIVWRRVEEVPFLDMRFSIDIGDGNPRGPFNRAAAEALLASGRLPPTATLVETREPFPPEEEERPVESEAPAVIEKEVIKEVRVEVPVEKIVEKEVIKEVRVEVPVEKIVEKVVVDETRVRELEVALKDSESSLKDVSERERKYQEQVKSLEDELRRLPQAASEVADIQAAVYSIITGEIAELQEIIEAEKREFEEVKRRHAEREDHLLERKRQLMKRAGSNIEDMTRKALLNRPEDPRTTQIRKEFEEYRRVQERTAQEHESQIRELTERLRQYQAIEKRSESERMDLAQLHQEIENLRAQLRTREKDLMEERQVNEQLRQQQATKQQVLLARLAELESPSIGSASSLATNQSREAKQVKLAGWMSFRK